MTTDFNHADATLRAVANIRNIIGAAHSVYDDENIKSFLRLSDNDLTNLGLKRAAAMALDTLGSSQAYIQKVIKTLGLETNGAELAKSFQAHAKSLRDEVKAATATSSTLPENRVPHGKSVQLRRIDGNSCSGSEYDPCSRRRYF